MKPDDYGPDRLNADGSADEILPIAEPCWGNAARCRLHDYHSPVRTADVRCFCVAGDRQIVDDHSAAHVAARGVPVDEVVGWAAAVAPIVAGVAAERDAADVVDFVRAESGAALLPD